MNNIMILGRLTKEPELKEGKNGMLYVFFTLASRNFAEKTAFINCIAFERTATILEKYTKKGSRISVKGYIDTVHNKDGNAYNIVKVEQLELADNKITEDTFEPNEQDKEEVFYQVEELGEIELPF